MNNKTHNDSKMLAVMRAEIKSPPKFCGGKWTDKELQKVALEYLGGLTATECYAKLLENRLASLHGRFSKQPTRH